MRKKQQKSDYKDIELLEISNLIESVKDIESTLQTLKERKDNFTFNGSKYDFPKDGIDFHSAVENYRVALVKQALKQSGGNQNKAAKLLNMNATTLHAIVKKHKLNAIVRDCKP